MINNPNKTSKLRDLDADANRDPITDEPGSHPIGTGLGAASGAAAGAAIGSAVGPIGTATGGVVGAVVGGIAGGYAGKGIAEVVNPTEIDTYYRENFSSRPYAAGSNYDTYSAAYRYGYDARTKNPSARFEDVESNLRSDWDKNNSKSLKWEQAKDAVRDSYDYTGDVYSRKTKATTGSSNSGNL